MNNPITYIEQCTLNDLLEFRKLTTYTDPYKKRGIRNSTRIKDLLYIGRIYLSCTDGEIANEFDITESAVKTHISLASNKGITYRDGIDDLMREIAYWKYKQLNI